MGAKDFLVKNLNVFGTAILAFFISAGLLFVFQKDDGGKFFFMIAAWVAAYYAYRNIEKEDWGKISKGVLFGLAGVMFLFLVVQTIKAARSNAEWDFMCFYMQGQLGLHKLNFYDPNSFNTLLSQNNFNYTFSGTFKSEIFDVGLLSPPITMLFFAPLAYFDQETSRMILSALTFILIIANSALANKTFLQKESSLYSFLLIFIALMVLPATNATIQYNQTTFFILFFLMLTILNIDKPVAGVYLALSLLAKPITGILILYFLFNKKWKAVCYFAATGIVLLLAAYLLWGYHNIIDFFVSPPTKRLPQWLYELTNNFSLIAVLNRDLKDYGLSYHLIKLIFIAAAVVMLGVTYVISKKLIKVDTRLAFFPYILYMLMIYPSSLECYMVFLMPALVYFLFLRGSVKYFWWMLLPSLSFVRIEGFFTYFTFWLALFLIGFFFVNNKTENLFSQHEIRPVAV